MRNIKMLAAVSAALLVGGGVSAKEQPNQPTPRKICRAVEEPGRITPRRICRVVPPSETATQDDPRKPGDAPAEENSRD